MSIQVYECHGAEMKRKQIKNFLFISAGEVIKINYFGNFSRYMLFIEFLSFLIFELRNTLINK